MPLGRLPKGALFSWPGITPDAPLPMWWSMRLWPSSPLLLASPLGNSVVAELRRMRVDSNVDAQRKTRRPLNSMVALDCASITRTLEMRRDFASKERLWTTLYGRMVRRPVCRAAGRVELRLLKYD